MRSFITSLERGMTSDDNSSLGSLRSVSTSGYKYRVPGSSGYPPINERLPLSSADGLNLGKTTRLASSQDLEQSYRNTGSQGTATTNSSGRLAEVCGMRLSLDDDAVGSMAPVHERLSRVEEQLSNERALRLEAEQRLHQRVSDLVGSLVVQELQKLGVVSSPKIGLHEPTGTFEHNKAAARPPDAPPSPHSMDVQLATLRDTTKSLGRRLEESQRRVEMMEIFVRQRFAEYSEQQRKAVDAKAGVREHPKDRSVSTGTVDDGARHNGASTENSGTGDAAQPREASRTALSARSVAANGLPLPLPSKAARTANLPRPEGNYGRGADILTRPAESLPRHALAELGSALAAREEDRLSRIESVGSNDSEPGH